MRLGRNAKIDMIQKVPLFARCSKRELAEVASIADEVDLREGKSLTREGDRGREFFVLIEGTADVYRRGKKINTMGPGDFFGEIALLENTPRVATVTAKTPLRFFVLTSHDFRHLLDENPKVERKVLQALARRVLALSQDRATA